MEKHEVGPLLPPCYTYGHRSNADIFRRAGFKRLYQVPDVQPADDLAAGDILGVGQSGDAVSCPAGRTETRNACSRKPRTDEECAQPQTIHPEQVDSM